MMSCVKLFLSLLLCFIFFHLEIINSHYIAPKDIDHCADLCDNNFDLLPKDIDLESDCQRGCRFFFLIDVQNSSLLNHTNSECLSSCKESYVYIKKRNACNVGCNLVLKSKEDILMDSIPFETIYHNLKSDGIISLKELNETFSSYIQYKKIFKQSTSLNFEERVGKWVEYTSKDYGVFKGFIVIFFVMLTLFFLYFSSGSFAIIEKKLNKNCYNNLPVYEPNLCVYESKLNNC